MEPENNTSIQPENPQSETEKVNTAEKPTKKPLTKKILVIVGIVLVLAIGLALALTIFRPMSPISEEGQTAERPNVLMATVGDRQIYSDEVVAFASNYITPSAIDDMVLDNYLHILIEREILDREAQAKGLAVNEDELNTDLEELGISSNSPYYKRDRDDEYYKMLKTLIEASLVSSITLSKISYWIPSPTDPEANYPDYATELQELQTAISEAQTLVNNGTASYDAALTVFNKYPLVQKRLAYNGVTIRSIQDGGEVSETQEYDLEKLKFTGDYFYNGVITMTDGETKLLVDPAQRGSSLVNVVSRATNEFDDYEQFLEKRTEELVKLN